jgi:methionyl-tRNA formyltransferase
LSLAYLGTSDFAAAVLRELAASPFRPELVVSPPDRRRGRGRKLSPPPVAALASELGLALHQTADVNSDESQRVLADAEVELGMVCAFGQLIRPALLERIEMLNLHPSLLPRWRGAAPIERAIIAGDEVTGVAVMRLTEGLDSGPVALCERVPIGSDEDFGSLAERLAKVGGELAVQALRLRGEGRLDFAEQPEEGVTYAEKIDPGERRLDPALSAAELARKVRALNPHVGTFVELADGVRLGVTEAKAYPGGDGIPALRSDGDTLALQTANGVLSLRRVKPAGKQEMTAADYLRGNPAPQLSP